MGKVTLHNEVAAAYRKLLVDTLDELADYVDLMRSAEVDADAIMRRVEMVIGIVGRNLAEIDRAIAEE